MVEGRGRLEKRKERMSKESASCWVVVNFACSFWLLLPPSPPLSSSIFFLRLWWTGRDDWKSVLCRSVGGSVE